MFLGLANFPSILGVWDSPIFLQYSLVCFILLRCIPPVCLFLFFFCWWSLAVSHIDCCEQASVKCVQVILWQMFDYIGCGCENRIFGHMLVRIPLVPSWWWLFLKREKWRWWWESPGRGRAAGMSGVVKISGPLKVNTGPGDTHGLSPVAEEQCLSFDHRHCVETGAQCNKDSILNLLVPSHIFPMESARNFDNVYIFPSCKKILDGLVRWLSG